MYYVIGTSVSSLHRESTDSLIQVQKSLNGNVVILHYVRIHENKMFP